MLRRVASRVSLRSRERKLRLFLELLQPGPETTVVDVGVTDAPFGAGSTRQLLRGALPVAGADHRRRARPSSTAFAAAFPRVSAVRADGRDLPFADGDVRPRLLERGRRARRGRTRRPAAVRARALPRRRTRVRDDAEPVVPARPAHAAAVRALAARRPARDRLLRARGFDDVLDPLGPRELASLFPYPVRIVNTGMTLVAVGPE